MYNFSQILDYCVMYIVIIHLKTLLSILMHNVLVWALERQGSSGDTNDELVGHLCNWHSSQNRVSYIITHMIPNTINGVD